MKKDSLEDYIEAITSRVGLGKTRRRIYRIRRLEKKTGADFGGGLERIFQKDLGYKPEEGNDYTASPEVYVDGMCDRVINPSDSILDLGCGKGFAMYLMGKYPFKRIYGLEKSEKLAIAAKRNLDCIYGKNDRFIVWTLDATQMINNEEIWGTLSGINYVYIYNSFPEMVMDAVVKELDCKVCQSMWKVTVWYAAPSLSPLKRMLTSECFELKRIKQVGGSGEIVYEFDSIYKARDEV